MDLCHPSYYKISQLGCIDGTKITSAFYVYMELCEVKRLWDVVYKYNSELDIIYIEAKKSESSEPETYIPWPTLYKISLVQIERIQSILKIDRLIFVFRGGDSTSVYYRVSAGLIKPISPEVTKQMKQKEEKKFELEQEIRRNTSILYEVAKSIDSNEKNIISEVHEQLDNSVDQKIVQNEEVNDEDTNMKIIFETKDEVKSTETPSVDMLPSA